MANAMINLKFSLYFIVFLTFHRSLCLGTFHGSLGKGMLYPRDSESRETKFLDGMWNFKADTSVHRSEGFEQMWYNGPLHETGEVIPMPVPSSYNDITELRWLKNFVGWVWYDRTFYIPSSWAAQHMHQLLRIVLRFNSVNYYCKVWLNGLEITSHEGGHLPFEVEVTNSLDYGGPNRLTVAVNNTLTRFTVPPGEYQEDEDSGPSQEYSFDFFNYAGIHRSVLLYTTPAVYLSDITIATDYLYDMGIIKFISAVGSAANHYIERSDVVMLHELLDHERKVVTQADGTALLQGEFRVLNPSLWWPRGMGYKPGYLYTLKVTTITNTTRDVYRLPVGIRSVRLLRTRFLINDVPFYFKGFGKHEDADFRGRGFDLPTMVKDFNLLDWFGANSFRTSHYPYSEETMNLADELGFVVIDECPAVGFSKLDYFNDRTFGLHLKIMEELIQRDKNHPSVVMWSVANEPISEYEHVADHLGKIIHWTKEEDFQTRPVTFVTNKSPHNSEGQEMAAKYCDVISFNRYYGWYTFPGKIEKIGHTLQWEMNEWYQRYRKPVLITEYGAEALTGLHKNPSVMYTEEYQGDIMKHYFPVFDKLRYHFLVGEMIWSFTDFATPESIKRVDGNHKGVLTRERQPKASAHILRSRYQSITLHHCHTCTGDELFDYLLRYRRAKRYSYDFEKPTTRLPALIRNERVNTTIDRRSTIPGL